MTNAGTNCKSADWLCVWSVPDLLYLRKKNGIDIREHGSGNAGTTNALRTLGKKAGAVTLLGDCLKCALAILAVYLLFGRSHPQLVRLLELYAGAGCILGHNFPFYLHFKGGKGIAASVGWWQLLTGGCF